MQKDISMILLQTYQSTHVFIHAGGISFTTKKQDYLEPWMRSKFQPILYNKVILKYEAVAEIYGSD